MWLASQHIPVLQTLSSRSSNTDLTRLVLPEHPTASARAASLRYVSDDLPGIRRIRKGPGFIYVGLNGKVIRDSAELERIKSLAIPPAWTDVWICPNAQGHLQATGRDAKGRKQHRYHPRWREVRDENKFERVLAFAKRLPVIRKRVARDLKLPGMARAKVLATVVRLLETTFIRVGNEEYARQNGSFGLSTMKNRHVHVCGPKIAFKFRGKSGIQHEISLKDLQLARIIRRCQDLPGYNLFQYVNDDGECCSVTSDDVNAYLKEIAGADFTTKDFRTWAATLLATDALGEFAPFSSQSQANKNIVQAIESVAKRLGHTRAVCRNSYIHPSVIKAYRDGSLGGASRHADRNGVPRPRWALSSRETAVVTLLTGQLEKEPKRDSK